MEWTDDAIVLSARKHGESAAIVSLLTRGHGRHVGLVRGGAGRRWRGVLQPGNEVGARWRARLAEHLGAFTLEAGRARAATIIDDAERLAGLTAACATADAVLPEREPHAVLYEGFLALLDAIEGSPAWAAVYVRWEVELLKELGFGLDLGACALTGSREDLAYVSPRTGRAVSEAAAAPYREKLLKLPPFLLGAQSGADAADIADGLALTGSFLERYLFPRERGKVPAARTRLVERIARSATRSSGINDP